MREAIPEPRGTARIRAENLAYENPRRPDRTYYRLAGKTINKIKKDTLVEEIEIEDDGIDLHLGKNGSAENARQIITDMTREYKVGERFDGEVVQIFDFGALVKINTFTGKDWCISPNLRRFAFAPCAKS